MIEEHTATYYKFGGISAGLLFGAAASLFNNLGTSIAFFLFKVLYSLVIVKLLSDTFTAFWLVDLTLIAVSVVLGVLGIWFGVKVAEKLVHKTHLVPEPTKLPVYGTLVFATPIIVWLVVQMISDFVFTGSLVPLNMGYLAGQLLIFSGVAYFLLIRYATSHKDIVLPEIAPKRVTETSMRRMAIATLVIVASVASALVLHGIEAVVVTIRGPHPLKEGFIMFNGLLFSALIVAVVGAGLGAFFLHEKEWRLAFKERVRSVEALEYALAAFSFGVGVMYAVGYGGKVPFLFSPYATVAITLSVLSGVMLAGIVYGKGHRDRAFVVSRVTAYLVGFFGQPALLGTVLAISTKLIS